MPSLIPEPYALLARIGCILAVLVAAVAFGYVKGKEAEHGKLEAFQLATEQAANKQTDHTLAVTRQYDINTAEVQQDDTYRLNAVVAHYDSLLADARRRASALPDVPAASGQPDAVPANGQPAATPAPELVSCKAALAAEDVQFAQLQRDAATTTVQYEELQQWEREQSGVR